MNKAYKYKIFKLYFYPMFKRTVNKLNNKLDLIDREIKQIACGLETKCAATII